MEKHREGVKITISWDTYPHFGVGGGNSRFHFCPEDGGRKLLKNAGKCLPGHKLS